MLNQYFGINTDDINESESERIARVFGLDDIRNWYPFKAARGNGKSLYCSERWKQFIKPKVEKVIFNGPATIVLWLDGTKTVVKCDDEEFDKEKGLAMAIAKRFLGTNKSGSNYYDVFKKWIFETPEPKIDVPEVIKDEVHEMAKEFRKPVRKVKKKAL